VRAARHRTRAAECADTAKIAAALRRLAAGARESSVPGGPTHDILPVIMDAAAGSSPVRVLRTRREMTIAAFALRAGLQMGSDR
jgi:hypothetical protein